MSKQTKQPETAETATKTDKERIVDLENRLQLLETRFENHMHHSRDGKVEIPQTTEEKGEE